MSFHSLPEEITERILSHAISPPATPHPDWHPLKRTSPLLVSKHFWRISAPILYRHVHITSPHQASLFPSHHLATLTRSLRVDAPFPELGPLLSQFTSLDELDIQLGSNEEDARAFCQSLSTLVHIRRLSIRKPTNVYLTMPAARHVLHSLAETIPHWSQLEHVSVLFRMSDDSGARLNAAPQPQQPIQVGPITAFTRALSVHPALKTFTTYLPTLWNSTLLTVSQNPHLEKISLSPDSDQGIVGTGIFLMQGWKHPRLSELIRAGTTIIRSRAQTLPHLPMHSRPSTPEGKY